MDEIVALAEVRARECSATSTEELTRCARSAVQSKLCICAADEERVVEVMVGEFIGASLKRRTK